MIANMTLNEYIETLVRLRDHYNAGEFSCELEYSSASEGGRKKIRPMDGDDFCLDIANRCCIVGDAVVYQIAE